jgi:Flp pilus assembly protein TadG
MNPSRFNLNEHRRTTAPSARTGALLAMELLFILPFLLLFVLAMVEFTFLITAETRLAAASREGARVAALGGDADDIQAKLDTIFGMQASDVTFQVAYLNESQNPGDPVRVAVSAVATALVPNYLSIVGFNLKDRVLTAQTVMVVE